MLLAADLCLFAYEEHSRWESAAMARGLSSEAVRELYCRTAAGYAGLDIADAAEKIRQVTEPLETRTDLTDEEVVLLTFVEPLIREESSYPEYLAQIQKNADVIGQISIFRTSGSFVMRSLDKTVSDYAPLAYNLGGILFRPGYCIVFTACSLFTAVVYGAEVTWSWIIAAFLISFILSVATPPVMGGTAVCFSILFSQLGLQSGALAIIISINAILEFLTVAVNNYCLQSQIVLLGSSLGTLDAERLRKAG